MIRSSRPMAVGWLLRRSKGEIGLYPGGAPLPLGDARGPRGHGVDAGRAGAPHGAQLRPSEWYSGGRRRAGSRDDAGVGRDEPPLAVHDAGWQGAPVPSWNDIGWESRIVAQRIGSQEHKAIVAGGGGMPRSSPWTWRQLGPPPRAGPMAAARPGAARCQQHRVPRRRQCGDVPVGGAHSTSRRRHPGLRAAERWTGQPRIAGPGSLLMAAPLQPYASRVWWSGRCRRWDPDCAAHRVRYSYACAIWRIGQARTYGYQPGGLYPQWSRDWRVVVHLRGRRSSSPAPTDGTERGERAATMSTNEQEVNDGSHDGSSRLPIRSSTRLGADIDILTLPPEEPAVAGSFSNWAPTMVRFTRDGERWKVVGVRLR